MFFILNKQIDIGTFARDLSLGIDDNLWFTGHSKVMTFDPKRHILNERFPFAFDSTYAFDGRLGAMGSTASELFVFDTKSTKLERISLAPNSCRIFAMTTDAESSSVFLALERRIMRVSTDGAVLAILECTETPVYLLYVSEREQLWAFSEGVQVFDLSTGCTRYLKQATAMLYVSATEHLDGSVMGFRGTVDQFDRNGSLLGRFGKNINAGVFVDGGIGVYTGVSQQSELMPEILRPVFLDGIECFVVSNVDSIAVSAQQGIVVSLESSLYFYDFYPGQLAEC